MMMEQTLRPERFAETVEKPHPACDEQHQEHENDHVHFHALAVIIAQP
jgi:hypothetical protein